MDILSNNNGSQREVMDNALHDLRNAKESNNLTAKVKGKIKVLEANKRGFVFALDFSTNPTMGTMSPSGSLVTTYKRTLDRMTCNYQYLQFGEEIDNENLANDKAGNHVGASSKALSAKKILARRIETEEWFFCRGDGSAVIGDITAGVSIAASVAGTLTLSGSRDGAGAWMLRVGQRVHIMDVTLATLKSFATVTAKTSNTAVTIVPETALTSGNAVVDTDVVLPEGEASSGVTAGVKGLPYLVKSSGAYFDKTLSNIPDLQAIVDSSTTTFTRTSMEYLYRRHNSIRLNGDAKTVACVSPAQMSNYFTQFFAQSGVSVNVSGEGNSNVDLGAQAQYTQWGQPIQEYKLLHPKGWYNLDFSSFCRLTLKEAGAMLTPAGDFIQKISGGAYANAQQRWDDDFLEYVSPNPARNSAHTALTFSGLPLLKDNPSVG